MKRFSLLLISVLLEMVAFAQRGKVRPVDLGYGDSDTSSSSDGDNIFMWIGIWIVVFLIIAIYQWFKGKK